MRNLVAIVELDSTPIGHLWRYGTKSSVVPSLQIWTSAIESCLLPTGSNQPCAILNASTLGWSRRGNSFVTRSGLPIPGILGAICKCLLLVLFAGFAF
jgi:hypothetical protein